ncbi:MAG: hypothetical protein ABI337_06270 [Nitrososphaera sp.]
MTKQKAIKILERFCQYSDIFSKGWKESSDSYKNPDLRDIVIMMGEIMERDSQIIKSAIDELKHDSVRKTKPLRH